MPPNKRLVLLVCCGSTVCYSNGCDQINIQQENLTVVVNFVNKKVDEAKGRTDEAKTNLSTSSTVY